MKTKKILIHFGIPLLTGALSAFLCRNRFDLFKTVNKPPLMPPAIVFPIVWTILYICMGYSTYLISNASVSQKKKNQAYMFYGIQLALNFLWSPAFFVWRNFMVSLVILIFMYFFIWQTIDTFREICFKAGTVLIPYAIWATFAMYLNLGILVLNP